VDGAFHAGEYRLAQRRAGRAGRLRDQERPDAGRICGGIRCVFCQTGPVRHRGGGRASSAGGPAPDAGGMLHQGSILLPDPAKNPGLREVFGRAFAANLGLVMNPGELTAASRRAG